MAGTLRVGEDELEMIVADGRAYARTPGEERCRFLSRDACRTGAGTSTSRRHRPLWSTCVEQ
ncbi:hypothetical protein ASE19_15335 [Nocardioides sp. Root79]|nr:hypothetical protein ASE19_15335 [Nocardioides sp. Root79]KRC69062.1 hypothetical protein ASE20_15990 [Nocardioides sp. Root240]